MALPPPLPPAPAAEPQGVFRRFERLQRLGMLGFIVLILALALVAAVQTGRSVHSVHAHAQTQALVGEINRLRGRLLDIEDALHALELGGDTALLRRRLACDPGCPRAATLQALSDDGVQQVLFVRLAGWEATLQPLLARAAADAPGRDEAAASAQPVITQMRRLLLQAEEAELAAALRHDEARRAQSVRLQLVLAAALLLAFGGALVLQRRMQALVAAGLRAEAALREASLRDPLTGLFNRRALDLHLERMLRAAQRAQQPLALLALDLDGFKAINDRLGHAAGDAALREVAQRLQGALRGADLVTRTGGDEFVAVLLSPEDAPGARVAAQRLRQALSEPLLLPGGQPAQLGASIGLALFPQHGTSASALLQAADAASYAAKRGGRNRVVVAGEEPAEPAPAPPGTGAAPGLDIDLDALSAGAAPATASRPE